MRFALFGKCFACDANLKLLEMLSTCYCDECIDSRSIPGRHGGKCMCKQKARVLKHTRNNQMVSCMRCLGVMQDDDAGIK